jgi:purine catabolism regulator
VTIRASQPVLPPLRGGEIVIAPARILRELRTVELIDTREAAITAVLLEEQDQRPTGARLPLLFASGGYVAEAETRLNRKITERRSELYRLGSELARALSSASLSGASIDAFLGVAETVARRRILLLDRAGEVVGQSSPGNDLPAPAALEQRDGLALRSNGRNRDWLVHPIIVDETGQEFAVAIDLARHESAEMARLVGTQVAASAALLLSHAARQTQRDPARERERFLREVLSKRLRSAATIESRARALGLELSGPHHAALVHAPSARALNALRNALGPAQERLATPLDDGDYAFIVPANDNARARWSPETQRGGGRADVPLIVVGPRAADPSGLGASLAGARVVAELATGGLIENEGIVWAEAPEQLGIFGLLLRVQATGADGTQALNAYAGHFLSRLEAEDAQRGSALLDSLAAYLDAGGSLTDAAARLGVHRNTLTYRLNRIRELTSADITEPRQRFPLQVAFTIRRFTRALAQPSSAAGSG